MPALVYAFEQKYSDDQPRDDHGRFAGGPEHQQALQEHLVDYKADRELTGPDSRAIHEIIPDAKTVGYLDVPNVQAMHERMGINPTLQTDVKSYVDARDELFNAQPVEHVPIQRLIFTQPRVNLPRAQALAKLPDQLNLPVQVIRQTSHDYLMNGHHRVVASALDGRVTINAHVLDLRLVKSRAFLRILRMTETKYSPDQPRDDHGRFGEGGTLSDTQSHRVIASLHAHGVQAALDSATPAFREAFQSILDRQPAAHAELAQHLESTVASLGGAYRQDVAEGHGIRGHVGPNKSPARIIEKAVLEEDGNLANIRDTVRGVISVDRVEQVQPAIDALITTFHITRVKDRFAEPLPTGYRDFLANVRLSNGLIGEVQIHVKPMLRAKETTGHTIYEKLRTTLGESATAMAARAALIASSAHLYTGAWHSAGGK